MSEIPDGVDYNTAKAAIANAIAITAMRFGRQDPQSADEYVDEFTRLYRKALYQLTEEPVKDGA